MVERKGKLDNYKIFRVNFVSHLSFVNDVLLFTKANTKSLHAIKKAVKYFSSFTYLQINSSKSSLIFSASVPNWAELLGILGFTKRTLPLCHLGIPIIGRELCCSDCDGLIGQL